ncbi:hypothetical protein BO86DRAFT_448250 [Aspergillus japonicus CBS 114.51]|uniref:Uncharacterized protein n=1 Tax=Aspergillus japonicus CBS 114.51 TaxID=1448312 RepID=A0A8T8X192_ASPJA|nr:hypothetical protein BO86DRAFT_448250 [Aspergillus japonicus CBS 114.51]RAH81801.1 hypothetical protein BO86DRAFT_448250 [Aspergillus japonicus CBS 114.51]
MASTEYSTAKGRALRQWTCSPQGLFVIIFCIHYIAWMGVNIWLLENPPQSMCHPTCDADNSPRQKWVEITLQVMYAHNYFPGFALAICNTRNMYLWCCWRLGGSLRTRQKALATLAWLHDCWFRLDNRVSSAAINPVDEDEQQQQKQQQQVEKEGDEEAGGPWRPPTPMWKMDVVVWSYMLNTVLSLCLAVCMWALHRSNRPYWLPSCLALLTGVVVAPGGAIIGLEKRRMRASSELVLAPIMIAPVHVEKAVS